MILITWHRIMLKRLRKVFLVLAALFAAGIIYYIITRFGIHIPCMFKKITGLYCPGCGVTRMCMNLIKLNFYEAFRSNQVCFFVFPVLAVIFARRAYCYVKYGAVKNEKWMSVIVVIIIIVLLIFGIFRNIPYFDFLRPL